MRLSRKIRKHRTDCGLDFPEEPEVEVQHDAGVQKVVMREGITAKEVFDKQSNRPSSLHVWPLVDGGNDRSFFEIGNHFIE